MDSRLNYYLNVELEDSVDEKEYKNFITKIYKENQNCDFLRLLNLLRESHFGYKICNSFFDQNQNEVGIKLTSKYSIYYDVPFFNISNGKLNGNWWTDHDREIEIDEKDFDLISENQSDIEITNLLCVHWELWYYDENNISYIVFGLPDDSSISKENNVINKSISKLIKIHNERKMTSSKNLNYLLQEYDDITFGYKGIDDLYEYGMGYGKQVILEQNPNETREDFITRNGIVFKANQYGSNENKDRIINERRYDEIESLIEQDYGKEKIIDLISKISDDKLFNFIISSEKK